MDLVLPPLCAVCNGQTVGDQNGSFCDRCTSGFRYLTAPFCRCCGIELFSAGDHNPLCGECLTNPPPYSIARSVLWYDREVQKLVHKLKYSSELSVVPGLRQLIGSYAMTEFDDIDYIVVVPLHTKRLRRRGLNQAAVLARLFFADRLPRIKVDWLRRIKNTVPQTGLDRDARRRNLGGVFQLRAGSDFYGKRVCLVDDVFTTGTTVKECSKVIMQAGAIEVKVLTIARVKVPQRGRGL